MARSGTGPHWMRGWAVYKSGWRSKFVGVFATRQEAEEAARKAGAGYEVRFGSYDEARKEFASGGEFATI